LIFLTDKGQMRVAISSRVSKVMPFGLSSSEQILASNLLGAMPMEQVRPVAALTASLMRCASVRMSSSMSLRSM